MYAWRGRSALGAAVEGQIEAATEAAVADQLKLIGVVPIHIALALSPIVVDLDGWSKRLWQKPIVAEDLLVFSQQMYTLDKAGVPILRGLAGLVTSSAKPAMAEMLGDIQASIEKGQTMSTAIAKYERRFGAFYVSMIRVGEMTGGLTEVFLHLSQHIAFEQEVRQRIKEALRYPMFVLIAMAGALVILNIFVIPVFAKTFASFHTQLPLVTRGLLGFSKWTVAYWPLLLGSVAAAVLMLRRYLATARGRYRWDARKLKLPVVGDIVLKATLARFARSFALSIQSGVPMVTALAVVAQTVDNAYIGKRIEQMRDGIERGDSISHCAAETGVFTPMVMQMIAVGEETGELDSLLFEISTMYERDTAYSIKGLSAAIEPILLAVIGVLVLLLALGVFLPLWNMGQAAMGH